MRVCRISSTVALVVLGWCWWATLAVAQTPPPTGIRAETPGIEVAILSADGEPPRVRITFVRDEIDLAAWVKVASSILGEAIALPTDLAVRALPVKVGEHEIGRDDLPRLCRALLAPARLSLYRVGTVWTVGPGAAANRANGFWTLPMVRPDELDEWDGSALPVSLWLRCEAIDGAPVHQEPGVNWRVMLDRPFVFSFGGPAANVARQVAAVKDMRGESRSPAASIPPAPAAPNVACYTIQFDEIEGTPLADFGKVMASLLGEPVVIDPGFSAAAAVRVRALGAFVVPKAELRAFSESMLRAYQLRLWPTADGLVIGAADGAVAKAAATRAAEVEVVDLAAWRHRFTPVRVLLTSGSVPAAAIEALAREVAREPWMSVAPDATARGVRVMTDGDLAWRLQALLTDLEQQLR